MLNLSLLDLLARGVVLLIALPIHELAHAWVAYQLGDDTAARQGRLTLNPIKHLTLLPSVLFILVGIGWATTPVNRLRLRYGPRVGGAIVSAAGPLSNLLVAVVVAIVWRIIGSSFPAPATAPIGVQLVGKIIASLVFYDFLLCLFNLIPLPPLDGFDILLGLVGDTVARSLAPIQTYGPMILMGILVLGSTAFNPLGPLFNAVVSLTRVFGGIDLLRYLVVR